MPESGWAGEPQRDDSAPDNDRWIKLYEDYHDRVTHYFARRVPCPQDVEDLVQNVFTSLLGHYNHLLYPQVYVQTVARHELFAYWRRRKRGILMSQILPQWDGELDVDFGRYDRESDPLGQLLRQESAGIAHKLVGHLTPALKEAMRLRFLSDLTPSEAAAKAGCSMEAMKKRVMRARETLVEWHSGM